MNNLNNHVCNKHVGILTVTEHARARWQERGTPGILLADALARAVPFGGQRGKSVLLRDGDAVFAIGADGEVRTVLTVDQAMANMQVHDRAGPPMPAERSLPASTHEPGPLDGLTKLAQAVKLLFLSDDELLGLVPALRGGLREIAQKEISRRNELARLRRHAERMESERKATYWAARRFIGEALVADFQAAIDEERQRLQSGAAGAA